MTDEEESIFQSGDNELEMLIEKIYKITKVIFLRSLGTVMKFTSIVVWEMATKFHNVS